jgi:hypothetical protein
MRKYWIVSGAGLICSGLDRKHALLLLLVLLLWVNTDLMIDGLTENMDMSGCIYGVLLWVF